MSAIRLARGYTGRDRIVKFKGCYHGHSDSLLVQEHSDALNPGVPRLSGIPESLLKHTLTLRYNDLDSVRECFLSLGDDIACIIVEPVAGNMSCILPVSGFLQGLRKICDEYSAILIFDEVMTGFRVSLGGAQYYYNVIPDITTLGKIVGGGLPVGAFGGKRKIMEHIAPLGQVYQAGTLSGNPVAMAAGLATLRLMQVANFHEQLSDITNVLVTGLQQRADAAGVCLATNQIGGMFGIFFTHEDQIDFYNQVVGSNQNKFKQFFHGMLDRGIYLAPSAFEAGFVSAAHGHQEINETLDAAEQVFASLAKS